MPYFTSRIWEFDKQALEPREGHIAFDAAACVDETQEDAGPLYVDAGLKKRDLVVFLGFVLATGKLLEGFETGYIVTHVNKDGSGILVSGDLMQGDPESWANPRTVGLGHALAAAGYGFEEFGLAGLQQFINTQPKP